MSRVNDAVRDIIGYIDGLGKDNFRISRLRFYVDIITWNDIFHILNDNGLYPDFNEQVEKAYQKTVSMIVENKHSNNNMISYIYKSNNTAILTRIEILFKSIYKNGPSNAHYHILDSLLQIIANENINFNYEQLFYIIIACDKEYTAKLEIKPLQWLLRQTPIIHKETIKEEEK